MRNRMTVACPVCGLFQQGLDILTAVATLAAHTLATLCTDDTYDTLVADTLADAENIVVYGKEWR